ncbi:MAG TPA: 3-hydroxyanthranilate 3,4-dioxygenase [Candidatus Acidoferrales bacterium]|nr:3-hydroxyanthranilate 3,4-dioxygenase [Candidatus Acidoferrales bacterium]
MFPHLTSFNLRRWIEENRQSWGQRRTVWEDSDFVTFVTRGPNRRSDFHINPGDEIFYQLEGELHLYFMNPQGKQELALLREGEMLLLPAKVPHSPRRGEGSWTLVIERRRRADEIDRFIWYCPQCTEAIYQTSLYFADPSDAVKKAYEALSADKNLRTCRRCGHALSL